MKQKIMLLSLKYSSQRRAFYTSKLCYNNENCVALVNYIKTTSLLKPILKIEDELLAPIVYNDYILDEIQNIQFILSRFSYSNFVRLWLLSRLEQDKIMVNAKKYKRTDKLLSEIEKIKTETIIRKYIPGLSDGYGPVITDRYYNKIERNYKIKNMRPILNINKKSNLTTTLLENKGLNDLYTGCYIIIFDNRYYYYIGSSNNLKDRIKTHTSNVNKHISGKNSSLNEFFKFFLTSEINFLSRKKQKSGSLDRVNFDIKILYLSTNYLNRFKLIYPYYRLSKGEWLLLNSITDFHVKVLEASLIKKFYPKLNIINKVIFKYSDWNDEYLKIYNKKEFLKNKKYGIKVLMTPALKELQERHINFINKYPESMLISHENFSRAKDITLVRVTTLQDLCYRYNLKQYEVLTNLNHYHYYEGATLKNPLKIIEIT